jgi:polysaccharide deacetylase family protein (PEP-CTERM system associated)
LENIFSVDVEDWYHLNFSSVNLNPKNYESRIRSNFYKLLKILQDSNSKATFFFLGVIAEQFPILVQDVMEQGHEIASHGYGHKLVYTQTKNEFYEDVLKSQDIIQTITNKKLLGYRAPSWSISNKTPWAYDVLCKLGFKYDASLFPITTFLYGDGKAPMTSHILKTATAEIVEIPMTVLNLSFLRIPFSGGFYLRTLPFWLINKATQIVNANNQPVIFYLHPREIDYLQPRLKMPLRDYFIAYYGLKETEDKVIKILKKYSTITIENYLTNLPMI